ncbi:MAG TPA: HIT domain-containing protein [Streptosporangiaceae bacterium]|nr:HIT domain-containing protein [Streptosporangiaceae bacterium]
MANRDSPPSRIHRANPGSGLEPEPGPPEDVRLVQEGAGDPDGFERLWTPHRMAYIRREKRPGGEDGLEQCPFCRIPALSDADGLVVARGLAVFTVLNLYPYNSGHLMVCPYRHAADYSELDEAETAELADHTKRAVQALRNAAGAQGFNVGMNLGAVAGAGIAAHLHQHVVPRWGGDTNFMPIVGQTRVLPQLLRDTRKLIAEAWPAA